MTQIYKLHFPANWWKGKKRLPKTKEQKKNMSESKIGKKASDETKIKMRNSQIKRYENKDERIKASIAQKKRVAEGRHNLYVHGNGNTRRHNADFEYKLWRTSVFERDNFICQMPGCLHERGSKLEAHHIKTYKNFPELRLDINNGITLCLGCHKKTLRKETDFEQLFIEILKI